MKKSLSFLFAFALCCALAACGGGRNTGGSLPPPTAETQPAEPPAGSRPWKTPDDAAFADGSDGPGAEGKAEAGDGILIAYFTYGENAPLGDGVDASTSASIQYRGDELTGNTGLVADMIADATGGELFSILTAEQYPDSYGDTVEAGQAERRAGARPELASHLDSLDGYGTVFLGFPNWWGDMPMAVYSFLDEYDLSGKTIVPFVTSGGSGFSGTMQAIEQAEPDAEVLEGLSIRDSRSIRAEDDVAEWLARIGLAG